MSFNNLQEQFESYVLANSLWNIPTNTRIETINLFNEISALEMSDAEKEIQLRKQLRGIIKNQPVNHIEAQQIISIEALLAYKRFDNNTKKAILEDILALEPEHAETVAA